MLNYLNDFPILLNTVNIHQAKTIAGEIIYYLYCKWQAVELLDMKSE